MAIVMSSSDVRDLFQRQLGVLLLATQGGETISMLKTQFCFLNSESLTSGLHIVICIFRLDPV